MRKAFGETHKSSGCWGLSLQSQRRHRGPTGRDCHPHPPHPCAFSACQRPRCAPPHSYRSFPGQASPFIFPPSPNPPQPETRTDPPRLRPTFRVSPALPATPFLLHPELWAASGFRAPPYGRRWEGTGRGGPNTPPERSWEAGTGRRGGANLLGAALPWQRGGGLREREEASRRGMWCCRGRHRSCRCLLVAASSRRRLLEAAGSSCGALPYCIFPYLSLASPLWRSS